MRLRPPSAGIPRHAERVGVLRERDQRREGAGRQEGCQREPPRPSVRGNEQRRPESEPIECELGRLGHIARPRRLVEQQRRVQHREERRERQGGEAGIDRRETEGANQGERTRAAPPTPFAGSTRAGDRGPQPARREIRGADQPQEQLDAEIDQRRAGADGRREDRGGDEAGDQQGGQAGGGDARG
jgi:hypothetical protein